MAQAADGAMIPITENQFEGFLKHGSQNVATVGDIFMVRGCYFEVETISTYGISAKGIRKKEYEEKIAGVKLKADVPLPKMTGLTLQEGNMI